MSAYDHVTLLLSFVYALALTHLLSRAGSLLLARKRVRFSPLQSLMMINAVTTVFLNWLMVWDFHGMKSWGIASIVISFLFAVANYAICATAAPEPTEHGAIDLDAFYSENYRLFYGVNFLANTLALGINFVFLQTDPKMVLETDLATVPFFLPCLLAFFVSRRWAQWTAGVGLFAVQVWWTLTFSSSLQ
jgi:hypothetical protein